MKRWLFACLVDEYSREAARRLLASLQAERGMAILLITHDLGVVARMAHRIGVMYAGELVEVASREAFFTCPRHPYTQALFEALPDISRRGQRLTTIPGQVPSLAAMPSGCRFADRCPHVMPVCREQSPPWRSQDGHAVRCHWQGEASAADRMHHDVSELGVDFYLPNKSRCNTNQYPQTAQDRGRYRISSSV